MLLTQSQMVMEAIYSPICIWIKDLQKEEEETIIIELEVVEGQTTTHLTLKAIVVLIQASTTMLIFHHNIIRKIRLISLRPLVHNAKSVVRWIVRA